MSLQYRIACIKAIAYKEFIQIKYEYAIYFIIIAVPFFQAIFYGYVINTNPKHLPTVIVSNDHSSFTQTLIKALENTHYFNVIGRARTEFEAEKQLQIGRAVFVINIPTDFTRRLIRGTQPHVLLEADATDSLSLMGAVQAANKIAPSVFNRNFQGALNYMLPKEPDFVFDIHNKYNPSNLVHNHTMPGLLGIILTAVLVMLTSVSIAGEYEQGTFETLLTTPAKALDVILGKLIPHFFVGYILYFLLILVSILLFKVPIHGSILLLTLAAAPFMLATLGVGLISSALSKSQFGAVTYSNLFILPSILLSGFIFPFLGMPVFAQYIGELLPATHFNRIAYNIMLKGSSLRYVWVDIWPILIIMVVIICLSALCYRKTLD